MEIEELTRKIYEEGVDKAKKQQEELLDEAHKEAQRVREEARREAVEVTETARRAAEQSKEVLDRELKAAADLALAQVKRRIADCLVDAVLPDSVKVALTNTDFIQKLISEVVEHWDSGNTDIDIDLILSPVTHNAVSAELATKLRRLLDRGLEVTVSEELATGFRIEPKDRSYRVSFEEENFIAFFREYLRERTRRILFPDDGDAPA